jgi:hypothetical protein
MLVVRRCLYGGQSLREMVGPLGFILKGIYLQNNSSSEYEQNCVVFVIEKLEIIMKTNIIL